MEGSARIPGPKVRPSTGPRHRPVERTYRSAPTLDPAAGPEAECQQEVARRPTSDRTGPLLATRITRISRPGLMGPPRRSHRTSLDPDWGPFTRRPAASASRNPPFPARRRCGRHPQTGESPALGGERFRGAGDSAHSESQARTPHRLQQATRPAVRRTEGPRSRHCVDLNLVA